MSDEQNQYYVEFNPGDLISAEDNNLVQEKIKKDIAAKIGEVHKQIEDHINEPVDAASFAGKTPEEWQSKFDERYVLKTTLEGNLGQYKRFYRHRPPKRRDEPLIIEHNMGRYPLIQVFELNQVFDGGGKSNYVGKKFMVYYASSQDPFVKGVMFRGNDVYYLGATLQSILDEIKVRVTDTQLFDDVLNDMWGGLFQPGGSDNFFGLDKHGHSNYISTRVIDARMTVKDLKNAGQWDDLRLAIRPKLLDIGEPILGDASVNRVTVTHITENIVSLDFPFPMAPTGHELVQDITDIMIIART